MQHLALQIREGNLVVVNHAKGADTRRRKVKENRRTQSSGTDYQHTRALERSLTRPADFAQDDMASVTFKFFGAQHGITLRRNNLTTGCAQALRNFAPDAALRRVPAPQ
jgi:hypothetical protein